MKITKGLCVLALLAAGTAMAEENPMAGKWAIHFNISGYEGDLTCALTQTSADVGGSCTNDQGTVTVTGKVEETKVTLQYKTEYNGDELTVVYTGKLDSGKLAGSVSVQPMGVEGEFTGTPAK
jgi:hypothetical protein